MTQQSVNEILGDVTELCGSIVTELGAKVFTELESAGVSVEQLPSQFKQLFDTTSSSFCNPFEGLHSTYMQFLYYKDHFGLVVSV